MEPDKTFKTKIALFIGYNGESFQGIQFQRQHTNTIQNVIHSVLVNSGFIASTNAEELKKIKWSRGARTDKRVHALCNGLSMKLQIAPQYVIQDTQKQINSHKILKDLNDQLPMDIRILSFKKVGKNFDIRHCVQRRTYNYLIPSKFFQSLSNFKEGKMIEGEELKEVLNKLNELVKFYLGTHNFYNFTRGYKQENPQCVRFMVDMNVQQVQQETIHNLIKQKKQSNMEKQYKYESVIRFTLIGQSFIYHQIRKMIGLLVKIFLLQLDGQATIKKAFEPDHFGVYLAPGQGLYLSELSFEGYNKKKDIKYKIYFSEEQKECIKQYRAYLESKILHHEVQNSLFTEWLKKRIQFEENPQKEESEDLSEEEISNNIKET